MARKSSLHVFRGFDNAMLKDFAISIIRTLREHGHHAYLVGGCVRDLLLGREPADYDITSDATPNQVMRIFPQTYAVGAQFGVVLVPAPSQQASPEQKQISVVSSALVAPRNEGKSRDLLSTSSSPSSSSCHSEQGEES
ncbi:MAG: metal dependent phosphohydrolase, partial [Acidobacteriaceae bacterium]|nr:metal dependent phosphohydrolase [Acidobacteriaceae bacterium]